MLYGLSLSHVVEFLLTECLPLNTVEKKSFRHPPWASALCSKMDNRTVRRVVLRENTMRFDQGCGSRCNTK
jgi:hypothetical protein